MRVGSAVASKLCPAWSSLSKISALDAAFSTGCCQSHSLHRQQANARLLSWPHVEQSSYLPALPEVGRAPGQGPDAECLAAAGAKDRRGGGQLHCAIRFEQGCLGLHLVAD